MPIEEEAGMRRVCASGSINRLSHALMSGGYACAFSLLGISGKAKIAQAKVTSTQARLILRPPSSARVSLRFARAGH